jgi:hypothetical protein
LSLGSSFFIHLKCKAAGLCLKVKNTLPVTPEIISSPIKQKQLKNSGLKKAEYHGIS